MISFGKIRAHIMKKLGVKMSIALQIAKKVRDEVKAKNPNVTDHDEIAKKSIEHFNANEAKFSAKAARM
jgi:2-phosphoglycerate kinase